MQDAFRARVLFPIFSDTGEAVAIGGRVLPGSTDPAKYKNSPETPIYAKSKTLYGLNWAKADIVNADQVVVCEGYTDVIGFHRAGVPTGGGDVRHGVHRGPRAAAQALRQPGRAGLRRRRRRPGRGRAVLRVGAEVPGAGVASPACPAGRIPASWPSATRTALAAAVADAVPFLGFRLQRVLDGRRRARRRTGPGWPSGRWRSSTSTPTPTCASCTPARWRPRSGCRSPTSCASPSERTRRPTRAPSPPPRRTAVRENAEFVAVALLAQDWDVDRRVAGRGAVRTTRPTGGRSSRSPTPGGDLDAAHRAGRSRGARGARAGRGRRPRRRSRGRGAQPDRRRRAPRAAPARSASATPSRSATTPRPGCSWKQLGDADRGRGGGGVVARLAPSSDGGTRAVGDVDERPTERASTRRTVAVEPPIRGRRRRRVGRR